MKDHILNRRGGKTTMGISVKKFARFELDPRYDQPKDTVCRNLADVGKVLRTRRKEFGWSQETMASVCDTNQKMISMIERGGRGVAFDTIARYAQNVGVDIILSVRGKA